MLYNLWKKYYFVITPPAAMKVLPAGLSHFGWLTSWPHKRSMLPSFTHTFPRFTLFFLIYPDFSLIYPDFSLIYIIYPYLSALFAHLPQLSLIYPNLSPFTLIYPDSISSVMVRLRRSVNKIIIISSELC